MKLSNFSIEKPILSTVIILLLMVIGLFCYRELPLRQYPSVSFPIVAIDTHYNGASASTIENKVTKVIEEYVSSIEGIKSIESQSMFGNSYIQIEFAPNKNIDNAINDIREKISSILPKLPYEVETPQISRSALKEDIIMWIDFEAKNLSTMNATDYAEKFLVDAFSTIEGVARVKIGGSLKKSLRVWINPQKLAEYDLTVQDIKATLLNEINDQAIGEIESKNVYLNVQILKNYNSIDEFKNLILKTSDNGYSVKLSDVSTIGIEPLETRNLYKSNGKQLIALGIIKQSKSNILDIISQAKQKVELINKNLPSDMKLIISYDSSESIKTCIHEVYIALIVAIALVTLVIFIFFGSLKTTLIPLITIPISLISTFIILYLLGYSINLLTLLALVLASSLVIDDAIIVLENIHRRMTEYGEPISVACFKGTSQVAHAILATALILIIVFVPMIFLKGQIGMLFKEFSIVIISSIAFSSVGALTIIPMLSKILLKTNSEKFSFVDFVDNKFSLISKIYLNNLKIVIKYPKVICTVLLVCILSVFILLKNIPVEFMPQEDQGSFSILIRGPEGVSYDYMLNYVDTVEKRLLSLITQGEFSRFLIRLPNNSSSGVFNMAKGSIVLNEKMHRKSVFHYMQLVKDICADLAGVKISTSLDNSFSDPEDSLFQFIIAGQTYEELMQWQKIILNKIDQKYLLNVESDYNLSKPYIGIRIDKELAATQGIKLIDITDTLENLLKPKKVTIFNDGLENYQIILENEKKFKKQPNDINNIYVRSNKTKQLFSLSNLVELENLVESKSLNHYNKIRSITFSADLTQKIDVKRAVNYITNLVKQELPLSAKLQFKGEVSKYNEMIKSIESIAFWIILIIFLLLVAQFESILYPCLVLLVIPFAIFGVLITLYLINSSINVYSLIAGLIVIAVSIKNSVLIVEYASKLKVQGYSSLDAIITSSTQRLRPIIMTTFISVIGTLPLIISNSFGKESRFIIGVTIFFGMIFSDNFFNTSVIRIFGER